MTALLFRAAALTETRFRKGKRIRNSRGWNLTGRRVQSASSVLPSERPRQYHDDERPVAAVKSPPSGQEASLIET